MKRVIHDRNDIPDRKPEIISGVDNVDRSGFIPLDVQYMRMLNAGENLAQYRNYQYNTDMELLNKEMENIETLNVDKVSSKIKRAKIDKVELDALYKDKILKYKKFKNKAEELQSLKAKYDERQKEKQIYNKAINDYKEKEFRRRLESQGSN